MAKKQMRRSPMPRTPSEEPVRSKTRADREFRPDYAYVVKDLKRIGMLAGSFFVLLIVLSFLI